MFKYNVTSVKNYDIRGDKMRKFISMILSILVILSFIGCDKQKDAPETPNTMPLSIIVDGDLYSTTGEEMPIDPDESIIKTATSVTMGTELPSKEGEINFPVSNAKYAKINDSEEYVVVMMDSEWVRFEKKYTWGVELTATQVIPTGLTLVFNQSGGDPTGDLQTGSMYWLEVYIDNQWVSVDLMPSEHDIGWTAEAYIIPMNEKTKLEVKWEWLYGKLPVGKYRIGKEVMDFRGSGDYDILNYYANFEIVK